MEAQGKKTCLVVEQCNGKMRRIDAVGAGCCIFGEESDSSLKLQAQQ